MFEIVFLGTSASAPSIKRGLSAAMVLHNEHRFLLDAGEGVQRQLLKSQLGFRRLKKILLTHGHLDHILGLGGLVSTFGRWDVVPSLQIYGGAWALNRVKTLLLDVVLKGPEVSMELEFVEVEPGVLFDYEDFEVIAFPVTHKGPGCFGYTFREKERRPFIVEKAEALGVPAGPERRRLVKGESVILADGTVVHPDQVLGEPIPGVKLVYVGDASRTEDLVEFVDGADALVIEATYLKAEEEMARRYGHLTASEAALLAKEAGVKQLILVHISRRYRDSEIFEEAMGIFPNVVVAKDFDRFRIIRKK
jgi:ribonuclease Z